MKCSCGRFEVPLCCKRYLEDAQGNLVHTETVCYEQGGFQLKIILARTPEFVPLNFIITDKDAK